MLSPARTTGIRAGTGQQVGGLCGASPGRVTAACLVSGGRSTNCSCQWGCGLEGGQVTIQQLRCSDGLWAGDLLLLGGRTSARCASSCCFLFWCCPSSGTNRCPWGSMCRPFSEVFPHPKDLCEKIWSNSFKYTTERRGSGRCIQMWFDPAHGNPNVVVAKYYAWQKRSSPARRQNVTAETGQAARALPWSVLVLLPLALVVLLGGWGSL